jgi:hypothetical protein
MLGYRVISKALAGVKEKDDVLEVDGMDVTKLRVQEIRKLLLGPPGFLHVQ